MFRLTLSLTHLENVATPFLVVGTEIEGTPLYLDFVTPGNAFE